MASCGEIRFVLTRRRAETSGSLSEEGRLRENGDSCCPLKKTGGDQLAWPSGGPTRIWGERGELKKEALIIGNSRSLGRRERSAFFFILFILRELSTKDTNTGSVEAVPGEPIKEARPCKSVWEPQVGLRLLLPGRGCQRFRQLRWTA